MTTPETATADPDQDQDMPWAQVRSVDPDAPDIPPCQHCASRPLFQFRAAYTLTTMTGMPVRDEEVDLWACQEHAFIIALGATMRVLTGAV